MSLGKYLAEKAMPLCGFVVASVVTGLFLSLSGTPLWICLLAFSFAALFFALGIAADYLVKRARVRNVARLMENAGDMLLLAELMPKPFLEENRLYYKAMMAVSRACVTEVTAEREARLGFEDYIESFVHEIKTPLTACALLAANRGYTGVTAELERADNCVENVMYYARSSAPETDVLIRDTDLRETAAEAIAQLKNTLIAARIAIELNGEGRARTDGKWVIFILKQLLVNCAKYAAGRPVVIEAGDEELTVSDGGCGIPACELPRVTDRGFTGASGRKRARSSGMGLYIVKKLCDRLSVGLDVRSKQGEGTTIALLFGQKTPD